MGCGGWCDSSGRIPSRESPLPPSRRGRNLRGKLSRRLGSKGPSQGFLRYPVDDLLLKKREGSQNKPEQRQLLGTCSAARAGTRGRTPRASGARCRGTGRPAAPGPRPRRDGATPAPRRADGVTLALHWATGRGLPNFHCYVCLALSGHVTLHCWRIYSVSENIVANQCHIAHSTPSEAVRTRGESAVCQRSASSISRCNSYRETALQQKTRL